MVLAKLALLAFALHANARSGGLRPPLFRVMPLKLALLAFRLPVHQLLLTALVALFSPLCARRTPAFLLTLIKSCIFSDVTRSQILLVLISCS